MASTDRKSELFERVVRLRRAERAHPEDEDIVAVRADLERELGPVMPRARAAQLLGLHHSSLQRWIESGDLPLVMDEHGRQGVPTVAVADLYESLATAEGESPRRHRLEPLIRQAHSDADRLDPTALVGSSPSADPHNRAARRSLAYHRAVAHKLRRTTIDKARHRVWQWRREGRIDPRYAEAWLNILDRPVNEVRRKIADDSEQMTDLRQSSPFAGELSEPERRKILTRVR
jgi:hypothetical protein